MRHALLTLLAAASLASAKAPQAPAAPQAPPCRDCDAAALCPCSVTGFCPCTGSNSCGCTTAGQYRWVATADPNQFALYRGAVQVGNWRRREGAFYDHHDHHDGTWSFTAGKCPVEVPAHVRAAPVRQASFAPPAVYFAPPAQSWGRGGGFAGGGRGGCSGGG